MGRINIVFFLEALMEIKAISAFSDNYIWTIIKNNKLIFVDTGQAQPVLDFIKDKEPIAILLTHKHDDHVGGVIEIKKKYPDIKVYGPVETRDLNDITLKDNDNFQLLGENFNVIETSGHTDYHISYLMGDNLFCGDALFLAGCGRVFTGDYKKSYESMKKFANLDDNINVYAGHEYGLSNLKFVKSIMNTEQVIRSYEEVLKKNKRGQITLPSTIGQEKRINPFMMAKSLEEFIKLRKEKDNF